MSIQDTNGGDRERLLIESRGNTFFLICSKCNRPFAEIKDGELRIDSKHGAKKDSNSISLDHLQTIAVLMKKSAAPRIEFW